MRLEHRTSEDQTFTERGWRIAPSGEIIDQHGGMVAGDVRTRLQSLEMRRLGTDRFNKAPMVEDNAGAECVRRQQEIEKAQAEHARVFQ
ncbi:MAG: hypothetical protein PHU85_13430 [Phycisphaerae bacterium]|nr:hypothetical protein [Phycisphaerae bacterium]